MMQSILATLAVITCCAAEYQTASFHQLVRLNTGSKYDRQDFTKTDPDASLNVTGLITSKGYPCEDHVAVTPDGFILSMQRIPHGRRHSQDVTDRPRPVVFLQHGLLDCSATWVMNLANESLGFILADAGYDVWLGNVRGNTYSRRHTKLTPSDAKFWEWSWDEMVAFDLPTMIHHVLSTSGQSQLSYIGHSQGSLMAFTGLSHNQELAKKINVLIALGPVYTVGHIRGLLRIMVDTLPEAERLFEMFGVYDFLPNDSLIRLMARTLCDKLIIRRFCENFVFMISGFDYKQLNVSRLPVYFTHTPAGTSVQNMVHFAQMVQTKKCQAFDYGSEMRNYQHYNQSTPPVYNISSLEVPTYLFTGSRDWLADAKDVVELTKRLKCVRSHEVLRGWEHLDFIWALDAATTLYSKILKILQDSNPMDNA